MITAVLTIDFGDKKVCEAVDRALSPDNIDLPRGMTLTQTRKGKKLQINVTVEDLDGLPTLISTVDEILDHTQVSVKVLG